jgi:hypothetical protein
MSPARLRPLVESMKKVLGEQGAIVTTGTPFGGAGEKTASAPMTAYNPSESERGFDDFLGDLVNSLAVRYALKPDLSVGLIVSMAKRYAAEGRLPPFPSSRAGDEDLGAWTAAAKTTDFKPGVLRAAQELADQEAAARSYGRR